MKKDNFYYIILAFILLILIIFLIKTLLKCLIFRFNNNYNK